MWKTFSIGESAFCRRTVLCVGALWPYVLPVGAAFGGGGGGKMCMRRNYRRGVVRFHYSSVLLTVVTLRDTHSSLRRSCRSVDVRISMPPSFSKETWKDDARKQPKYELLEYRSSTEAFYAEPHQRTTIRNRDDVDETFRVSNKFSLLQIGYTVFLLLVLRCSIVVD